MKIIFSLLLFLLISSSLTQETQSPPEPSTTSPQDAEVERPFIYGSGTKAFSGDTFEFEAGDSDNSTRVVVRLVGVQAPKKGELYFEQSKAHLHNLVTYKFLKVEIFEKIEGNGMERLDYYVGLVKVLEMGNNHGSYLNQVVLDKGYARHKAEETAKYEKAMNEAFELNDKDAQEKKRGMWAPDAAKEKVRDETRDHGFAKFADKIQTGTKRTKMEEVKLEDLETEVNFNVEEIYDTDL